MGSNPTSPTPPALPPVNAYGRQLTEEEIARGEHRAFVGGLWEEVGALQLEFLRSRGLEPRHRLADVGCGALRGGIPFIGYLEAGRYFGLDINASLIAAARVELARAGLEAKAPALLVDGAFSLGRFETRFDFALAVSVFTHLPVNAIVRCLVEVRKTLAEGGRFFATWFEAPSAAHLERIRHEPWGVVTSYDADPYHYGMEEIRFMAAIAGLDVDRIGDFGHPRGQRMLEFRLPGGFDGPAAP